MEDSPINAYEGIIKGLYEAFETAPKPSLINRCDCGSCISNIEADKLLNQDKCSAERYLINKLTDSWNTAPDKLAIRYYFPRIFELTLEELQSSKYVQAAMGIPFYFIGNLKSMGFEEWPEKEKSVTKTTLLSFMNLMLMRGRVSEFDEWLCGLIAGDFDWEKYAKVLLKPEHSRTLQGFQSYFIPWANGYTNSPRAFTLAASWSDELSQQNQTKLLDWITFNLS